MADATPFTIAAGRLTATVWPHGATLARLALDGVPVVVEPAAPGGPGWINAICGRVANRLGQARAGALRLVPNDLPHILHGGHPGLSHRDWRVAVAAADRVRLAVVSPAGEAGFPGTLDVTADWVLAAPAVLTLTLTARVDAAGPVNLCQHLYLNLAGGGTVDGHRLMTVAGRYLATDAALIPTGAVLSVEGTPLDYRAPRPVGAHDATLILGTRRRAAPAFAARLEAAGRSVEVWTTEPALHLYTGEHLPGAPRGGLCLEAMGWTDAPNHRHFPSVTLEPGRTYRQVTQFRFA
jgi:aldose 1-epimerase